MGVRQALEEMSVKFSIPQIASFLGNIISTRTLYRWLQGESEPQRGADRAAVLALHDKLLDSE